MVTIMKSQNDKSKTKIVEKHINDVKITMSFRATQNKDIKRNTLDILITSYAERVKNRQ